MSSASLPPWNHRLVAAWCRRPNHPLKLRLLRWARWLLRVGDVRTVVSSGVVMELDPGDYVQREILFHGAYETASLALVRRLLADATVFVDIGAHVGQYSLTAAAALAGRGRVYSFEPTPKTGARLLRNARLSGTDNLHVLTFGVSDTAGLAHMAEPPPTVDHGQNWGGTRITGERQPLGHTIATFPLATVAASLGWKNLDVVKIDVEGHEAHVLRALFAPGVPRPRHLLVEHIPSAFDADEVPTLLRAHGYLVRDITGRTFAPGDDAAALPEANLWASLPGASA